MLPSAYHHPDIAAGYAASRPPLHETLLASVPRLRGECALDLGCGSGLSTRALQRFAPRCLGLEPALPMLPFARSLAPRASFFAARAESIPLRNGEVDLITAAGSLNYMRLDVVLPELARVLKPAGSLVVYDFAQGSSWTCDGDLAGWFQRFLLRHPAPAADGWRPLTPGELGRSHPALRLEFAREMTPAVTMDFARYHAYLRTETNLAGAVLDEVLLAELRELFGSGAYEILFPAYVARLVRA